LLNPVVATMTLVREPAEERSVFDALASLARAELPVIVADGGSPPGFVQAVRALPQYEVVQPQAQGLVPQVRAALERARELRVPWILYTEPDKRFFFAERLAWFLDAALQHADSALILASRSREAFDTFPTVQRLSESAFNSLFDTLTGFTSDCLYGPFLVRAELVDEAVQLPPSVGWGWRPFLFARALRRGLAVSAVTGDFLCPVDQRDEDDGDRIHRLRQLTENLAGLLRGLEE
jgi:hypothetical protein